MKNRIFYPFFFFFILSSASLLAQELQIKSEKVQYDDVNKVTTFEGGVNSSDEKGNKLFSEYAKYNNLEDVVETTGETRIVTSGSYELLGSNIVFDNKNQSIYSNYKTQIIDVDGNKILVDMFTYSTLTNIFFSKGNIELYDINNNSYKFSEIYIDENKKKIVGSDAKIFLNPENVSGNVSNEPRLFANTVSLSDNVSTADKGIFTYCKNRENDKCPPWSLKSEKIRHDLGKKTIFYENVVLKVYDFPIFYSPKFSHPDPSVKRRSGLLAPSMSNSTNLGTGLGVPYFWDISNNKDLTLTPKIYLNENPLMLAEYRQDFKDSYLIVDAGYTKGYKQINSKGSKKTEGGRAHLFSNFIKNLIDEDEKKSILEINLEKVSNDTYFKVYDVNTSLVDKNQHVLTNKIDLTYQDKDFYFSLTPSVFEDTTKNGRQRHEYLLPLAIEKNIMSNEKYGFIDLDTDLKIRNYETNKQTSFFVNDFNWRSNSWLGKFGFENYFEGLLKAVNYESKNTKEYKNDVTNSELNSSLGYFTKLNLFKNDITNKKYHTLTPKLLLRYAPGHMRKTEGGRLSHANLFNLNKINEIDVIENGLSSSIGFDYKKNKLDSKNNINNEIISISAGQVISAEENMDIPSSTSLDQKFSDIVGVTKYNISDKINLEYNFSLDQSYKKLNYNEISTNINYNKAKFNIGYLQERNHIGNQEFVQSNASFGLSNSSEINFSTKRNLLTSSAEFYNLSYNYLNDCLRAGIGYRREFYTDRDVEPSNTLMFTISIIPFAEIDTASFSR